MGYGNAPRKEYDDSNTLWLRKNTDKQEDWHADYKGDGKVDGREFFIDGKVVKTKKGETVLRLKVKAKTQQRRDNYSRQDDRDVMSGDDFL